jgi:hypothetical protein
MPAKNHLIKHAPKKLFVGLLDRFELRFTALLVLGLGKLDNFGVVACFRSGRFGAVGGAFSVFWRVAVFGKTKSSALIQAFIVAGDTNIRL